MREQNPALPVTPARSRNRPSTRRAPARRSCICTRAIPPPDAARTRAELFDEIVARIRDAGCDVILNLSTGEGGRFIPSDDDPQGRGAGQHAHAPELRVAHVERLRPKVCTLDFNTMYSGHRGR
jgi:uncharacterized protein (DUF849 family)